jgi:hypothetical protein
MDEENQPEKSSKCGLTLRPMMHTKIENNILIAKKTKKRK